MFLKRILNLRDTLSFRLTIWYAGIFTLSSLLSLSVFYYRISTITMERTDNELLEEIDEFSMQMAEGGLDQVKNEIVVEVESEGEDKIFFRLLSIDGKVLATSNMQPWGKLAVSQNTLRSLSDNNKHTLDTLIIPNHMYKVRTVFGFIGPTEVMQIGLSLEDNDKYLQMFRNLLLLLMIPLFIIASVIGLLMARKALTGVEEVTQTAIEISKGSYDKRVQVKKRSAEIDRLTQTFNGMLDRLQGLLKTMREMNDNIAHDLRSPLTRIRGIAEMTLISKTSTKNYEEMAASTIEECDNLIDMINTMLEITETEAGVAELQIEKVDLNKLILDAYELFCPIADEKNVNLNTNFPEKIFLQGDRNKLQRMITNLLENAIKYTPPGGTVTISIDLKEGQVGIIFEDTGIGIPKSDLPYIFDRFYRCDKSRSQAGIGLGLSLVKAFTEALKGTIMVASTPDKGSTFTIMMPH